MRRLSVLALLFAAPAFAQPPGEVRSFAQTVAPFIDEHTLVVVRVDVTRVDLDPIFKVVAALLGDGDEVGEGVTAVRAWVKEFTKRGGNDVFLTYGAGDYPNLPCLIAPAPADEASRKALAELLLLAFKETGKDADWALLHGCLCVGTKEALAVAKARKAVARPELTAAIDAGKEGVAQLAFALSAEAKKIHEQVAPILPAELGGGGIQKITRGMRWMAVTVGAGPKMPAKWITEAASPEAAQDLKAVEALAQQAALSQLLKGDGATDAGFRQRVNTLIDRHTTTLEGSRLTAEWELATTLLEAVKIPEGPPAERARSANNLKHLLLALHNYHDTYGHFPTDVRDKEGKPLLSWRVQILPFIEQDDLYKQFKLDEPWDSEHNKKLIKSMPKVLRSPRQAEAIKDRTTYLAPLGKGLMWDEPKGLKITQIADGTSNTIALVEADDERAVVWTKPEDITIDPKKPIAGLLGHYGEGFYVALADGSVRFVKKSIDPAILWGLFTRSGGESPDFGK
jgi:hypothetical protein